MDVYIPLDDAPKSLDVVIRWFVRPGSRNGEKLEFFSYFQPFSSFEGFLENTKKYVIFLLPLLKDDNSIFEFVEL